MKVFQQLDDIEPHPDGTFCTIGMFDGLHLGHQHVIDQTIQAARSANGRSLAITFDPHPARIVAPDHAPAMIYPSYRRQELLQETKLDTIWMIPFDQAFSRISGPSFLERICQQLQPLKLICVGPDFHFGHKRSGNLSLLQARAEELGYIVPQIDAITANGKDLSSTVIRSLISSGDFDAVASRLGRPYEICGAVQEGDQVGRKLGFPTANLDAAGLALPPFGVYAVRVSIDEQELMGVMNIGIRPTRDTPSHLPTVEVHLFDWDTDLYGQRLAVRPAAMIRPEQRFSSLEALQTQIQADCEKAKTILAARS